MEVEFTVLSDRREGLLRGLGNVVIQSGFTLLRQRMSSLESGIQLWLRVSGREECLLELEERLGSHPMVLSFESEHQVSPNGALAPRPPKPAAFSKRPSGGVGSSLKAGGNAGPAVGQIEAELPGLAKEYPRIFPRLLSMHGKLPDGQVAASMEFAGRRVGAWVYKRDYALGGRLDMSSALKQIALPALRNLLPTDLKENSLRIKNNPLCMPGGHCRNGDFFCGFLQGLLEESGVGGQVTVREIYCRSEGAEDCVFEIVN
ncbi:4-vinyl reductase [Microbulbifer litoralis]|uniref:4-vinyl reductase n=1 Tax=Microbulbifer litoralis TaxID=2933965 RepID=UPI0020291DCE|nr:4-vinyl reductase [Microbulbifer sp. GX H0434]